MKNNDQNKWDDNFIDQKAAESFGYSDEQLALLLDRAAVQAAGAQTCGKLPAAPDGELQKIKLRLEREEKLVGETGRGHRPVRLKKLIRPLIVAAILGTMVLGGGMWVGAKRYYVWWEREVSSNGSVVVLNNADNLIAPSENEQIYDEISKELGIKVLKLTYLPSNMNVESLEIENDIAKIKFADGDQRMFFYQSAKNQQSSLVYMSDMVWYKDVYNKFLDKNISVYTNEYADGKFEFSARILEDDAFYILQGIVSEEEFIKIVEKIEPLK